MTDVPTNINIDSAVTLYHTRMELTTGDIQQIFGCGATKANQLRRMARAEQDKAEIPAYNAHAVNAESAYKTWGLDIKKLERAQKHPKIRVGEVTG